MPLLPDRLNELLGAFRRQRILVIGDLMLDEFVWGKVSRISQEAPVPVVDVQRCSYYPGGAANVARNLCAFSSTPTLAGVIGRDDGGKRLLDLLNEDGIDVGGIVQSASRPTTQKTRIIARHQQVVRVDRETRAGLAPEDKKGMFDFLDEAIARHDAVIIEDYGKGLVDQELVSRVITSAVSTKKLVAIDPNPHNPMDWRGATVIKPNRAEAFQSAGLPPAEGEEAILKAAKVLQKKWDCRLMLITLGEEGMLLLERDKPPYHTPTRAREVFDVSGAGDTSIALFTLALAAGATAIEAAETANHAAGVVVAKLGTATLTPDELRLSFGHSAA